MRKHLETVCKTYKDSAMGDERGFVGVYVLAGMGIFLLLAMFTTFAYAAKIQQMATTLHRGIKDAATIALSDNTIPDPVNYGMQVNNTSAVQQEFMNNMQTVLQNWPQSTYTLQSFKVYGESDRGSPAPIGFYGTIPGTSAYVTMNMNIAVTLPLLPLPTTHWAIPLHVMVSANSFEESTRVWNLAR
ncbi:hypothetical protein CEB3_c05310 [Peptococcaceae bacterium CEB3]|nr:hypothetical protein CEB3_c05310 [Peptococcaceae bacterium CEB3]